MPIHALGDLDVEVVEPLLEARAAERRSAATAVHLEIGSPRAADAPSDASTRLGDPSSGAVVHVRSIPDGVHITFEGELEAEVRGLSSARGPLEVVAHPAPGLAPATLRHLLLDQLLPRLAFQRGGLVLHAGAAELDGQALVALGASGVGKSCFVAACLALGGRVLSDDAVLVRLDATPLEVEAWYPSVRLHAEARAALAPGAPWGDALREPEGKRRLRLSADAFVARAPLGHLLVLERGKGPAATLTPLATREAVRAVVGALLRLCPGDPLRGAQELAQVARLLEQARVWRFEVPDDLTRLVPSLREVARALGREPPPRHLRAPGPA